MSDLKNSVQAAANAGAAPHTGPANEAGPDTPSADYELMRPLWEKVQAFSTGVDGMRRVAKKYLPKFELEDDSDYDTRINASPFTNVYEDVSGNLAAKPFSREVQFEEPDTVDEVFKDLYEDIDGQGNNLHVFLSGTFQEGLDNGIDWILVDFTKLPPLAPERTSARSVDEEKALGARPYWVRVAGSSVVAVYSAMVRGEQVFTHVRIKEPTLVREGYKEVLKDRVRVYDREAFKGQEGQDDFKPATWELFEKRKVNGKDVWVSIDAGPVAIKIIPIVPFRTGKRIGNGWAVKAPLAKIVDMQMDAYQQESNKRNIELLVCYPMLTANGVAKPAPTATASGAMQEVRVPVGPRAVLWAPPQPGGTGQPGSWAFIEPSAESVKVLQGELSTTWQNMREIGMQPLAEANITVITSANVSVKAKSVLQALALLLKDAAEQAMEVTALWLNLPPENAPGIDVYKDFGVDLQSGQELSTLETMAKDGFLSGETLRSEAKRRNVLSDNFNEEDEQERMAEEAANAGTDELSGGEQAIDPATGQPLSPANNNGTGQEGVDPSQFGNASEIDDGTLRKLFGDRVADAAGLEGVA